MTAAATIRPFRDSDVPDIIALMREALGETEMLRRTPDLFAWKHLHNPFGRSIMLVAEDDDGIVGFRALMRWKLDAPAGYRLRCVRAVDTATHHRVRRQGVFRRLTMDGIDLARSEGVDLVFNTPNPRSGAGYLKMGWQEVGRIGVLVRPLLRGNWQRSDEVPSVIGSRTWSDTEAVEQRAPLGLRTPRTPEYLKWRYSSHPFADYQVIATSQGRAVVRPNLRNGRRELVISDLFGVKARDALRLVARSTDAAYLVGSFSPGSPERFAAVSIGMLPLPRITALTLFARPLSELPGDVQHLTRWDLTLGDMELL